MNLWENYDYNDYYNYILMKRKKAWISNLELEVDNMKLRRWKVRPIFKLRKEQGDYHNLVEEMRVNDKEKFFNYLRMPPNLFDSLVEYVSKYITKNHNIRDDVISPAERLALTIRYMASGDSMTSISYAFRVGTSTVSKIIKETCLALWDSLNAEFLPHPTENDLKKIADEFHCKWNMPHCTGALDGKHVIIQAFSHSGSQYYNYKSQHSVVLLASCDANYKFVLVDVGAEGRNSDGGIFKNSEMGKLLQNGELGFPKATPLNDVRKPAVPYFMVGDEAFPLSQNLMRPFPGRSTGTLPLNKSVFNYRLSRARRCIENAFGIMASKFRIFRKPILASEETVQAIILAAVVLHNFLIANSHHLAGGYVSPELVDHEDENGRMIRGTWRNNSNCFHDIQNTEVQTECSAEEVRQVLCDYFMHEGSVPWQNEAVLFS